MLEELLTRVRSLERAAPEPAERLEKALASSLELRAAEREREHKLAEEIRQEAAALRAQQKKK